MNQQYSITPAEPARPVSIRTPARIGPLHPAQVSPVHLPALSDVASDLDGLGAPVKIVNPLALDWCDTCAHGDDVPELGAIVTVVAKDPYGFGYRIPACALHLAGVIRHFGRHHWPTVVEAPTCSPRWFERCDRETYWGLDETHGIAVVRSRLDVWVVFEAAQDDQGYGHAGQLLAVSYGDDGDAAGRAAAEVWAQDCAAQRAADAHEASFAVAGPVALPVVAVSGVAA